MAPYTTVKADVRQSAVPSGQDTQRLQLHYGNVATEWAQSLPLGNGRLGAMVYGRTGTELIRLNENSVWYGGPQNRTPRDALKNLPLLRQLIRQGKHAEAEDLCRNAFFSTPASMRHYEPLGSCMVEFGHGELGKEVSGYRRQLDLQRAMSSTTYQVISNGSNPPITVKRHMIASFPDDVLLLRIEASQRIRFLVRLNRTSDVEYETNEFLDSLSVEDNLIILHATPGGRDSNRLCIALGVVCDDAAIGGSVKSVGNCLVVNSAACTIAIGSQTTFRYPDVEVKAKSDVEAALKRPWTELLTRHEADYRSLFDRVSLRLSPDAHHIPTDERLKSQRDPGLVALFHNYGRYLLISSSRDSAKALPANLQGLWNPSFAPPWGSKYTININLQMNYWPASSCSLFECATPVVSLLERMAERGAATAEQMYGCRGWCAHHNTDIWADTDPQDKWMPSTLWPLGGVWVCIDMVKLLHYQYSAEIHRRLHPVLEGSVQFLLDFLITSECGKYLVTNPSLSPENTFISESGQPGIFCEGSTMDINIVRTAFELYLWSVDRTTGSTSPSTTLKPLVQDAIARLPPIKVNKAGLIQEWGLKDYAELEPGHRHVSHLLGLYPGTDLASAPELRTAARKVLDRRAAHGGGHTGWSRAWLVNLHARLGDAQGCGRHVDLLLRDSTLPNLLDNHPPFQIDGNFGGCAGVLECLVQSSWVGDVDGGVVDIRLLPACPREWASGRVEGVRVLGGWEVSFTWEDGKVVEPVKVSNASGMGSKATVAYGEKKLVVRG